MPRSQTITVEKIEISRRELQTVKRTFHISDDAEAVRRAVDIASGVIDLENIFTKNRGAVIEKNYA